MDTWNWNVDVSLYTNVENFSVGHPVVGGRVKPKEFVALRF